MAIKLNGGNKSEVGFIYNKENPVLGVIKESEKYPVKVIVGKWSENATEKIEIRAFGPDRETKEIVPKKELVLRLKKLRS